MLLDLGRNDVGRVSKLGTVEVTDQFFIERYYSHVMHIVSNVTGELATLERLMRLTRWALASRPARCPARPKCARWKSSTSWNSTKRGIYAGCVGYFDANGADGHLHRAAHGHHQRWGDVCAGRRGHRRRFRP
jgi:anthranilate synthase component 1